MLAKYLSKNTINRFLRLIPINSNSYSKEWRSILSINLKSITHKYFCENVKQSNNFSTIELSESEYQSLAEQFLDSIHNQLDNDKYFEKITNLDYHDGVLDITVNQSKKYVLNLQRPNKQIWVSSPISGPQRFELFLNTLTNEKEWLNKRSYKSLKDLLSDELTLLMDGNKNENFKINLH